MSVTLKRSKRLNKGKSPLRYGFEDGGSGGNFSDSSPVAQRNDKESETGQVASTSSAGEASTGLLKDISCKDEKDCRSYNKDKEIKSIKSPSKHSTVSSTVKLLEAELEAQKAVAKLKKEQLEEEEKLIYKRLQLEKARIKESLKSRSGASENSARSKKDVSSATSLDAVTKVRGWLDRDVPEFPDRYDSSHDCVNIDASNNFMFKFAETLVDKIENITLHSNAPKDLPFFSGRPDEWPPFIFAYKRTERAYSVDDNLIRVQRSLKGDAFESVRSLFVSPENINTIIKTLEIRFGRPEFILNTMMEQARSVPTVKENDTSALISYFTTV